MVELSALAMRLMMREILSRFEFIPLRTSPLGSDSYYVFSTHQSYGAHCAFQVGGGFFGGRRDSQSLLWIGIELPEPVNVAMVQLQQVGKPFFCSDVYVQYEDVSTSVQYIVLDDYSLCLIELESSNHKQNCIIVFFIFKKM